MGRLWRPSGGEKGGAQRAQMARRVPQAEGAPARAGMGERIEAAEGAGTAALWPALWNWNRAGPPPSKDRGSKAGRPGVKGDSAHAKNTTSVIAKGRICLNLIALFSRFFRPRAGALRGFSRAFPAARLGAGA